MSQLENGTVVKEKKVKMKNETDVIEKKVKMKNWTTDEINFLVNAIDGKKFIIESKATNRSFKNLNEKNETWQAITNAYNNRIGYTFRYVMLLNC